MSSNKSTGISIFFLKIISKFPFWLIYFLSDIIYFIVFYVVGYRKKVVLQNLKNSFPDKTTTEIRSVSKKFFRHFCDLSLEIIKIRDMKEMDYRNRMIFSNEEIIHKYHKIGQSIIILSMHYNNWEWTNGYPVYFKQSNIGVYKPLANKTFDVFMKENRTKMGGEFITNNQALRRIIQANKKNETFLMGLAADQTPPYFHKSWFTFMNQEALFYPGPAYLSKKFNLPVLLVTIEKVARGKYLNTFEVLFENPAEYSEAEIIKTYIRKIEKVIKEKPEFYLWSHRRWKHKRPKDVPLQ